MRRSAADRVVRARAVLDSLTLLQLPTSNFEQAARLDPTLLRTLDSVHLAAALSLGDDLDSIVTYDDRQARAAQANGIPTTTPV